MSVEVVLHCDYDGCSIHMELDHRTSDPVEARRVAYTFGWRRSLRGFDYCEEHAKELKL